MGCRKGQSGAAAWPDWHPREYPVLREGNDGTGGSARGPPGHVPPWDRGGGDGKSPLIILRRRNFRT